MTYQNRQPAALGNSPGRANPPTIFTAAISPELAARLRSVDPTVDEQEWMVRLSEISIGQSPSMNDGTIFKAKMTPLTGSNLKSFFFECHFVQRHYGSLHLDLRLAMSQLA